MPASLKRSSSARDSVSPPAPKRRVESTTTNKAVASFFTPASKKEPDRLSWHALNNSLLIGRYTALSTKPRDHRRKVAAFDLDSTLIKSKSGNTYPKDVTDWQWWDPSVPAALKQLYADGYLIAVLTNQGRLSLNNDSKSVKSDKRLVDVFKTKVGAIFNHFDFPVILFAATARDKYRKPRTGMWDELLEDADLHVGNGPDLDASFFVGDAGGRPAEGNIKADHACSDRDLAMNIGIRFKTPEEFFLEQRSRAFSRIFEPRTYLEQPVDVVVPPFSKVNPTDIVIFCGSPAAGKSTFYWTTLKPLGYERVNQDLLKTRDKCVKVATDLLSGGTSVAVDNTNADVETRAVWIQLASKLGISIRCVHFTASSKLCEHNDTVRALANAVFNPEKRAILPHSAFAGFASRFKEPSMKEGFQDITKIDFQFQGDAVQRLEWAKYWT